MKLKFIRLTNRSSIHFFINIFAAGSSFIFFSYHYCLFFPYLVITQIANLNVFNKRCIKIFEKLILNSIFYNFCYKSPFNKVSTNDRFFSYSILSLLLTFLWLFHWELLQFNVHVLFLKTFSFLTWVCLRYTSLKVKFFSKDYSVNVTKFAGNCGFGHIYKRNS